MESFNISRWITDSQLLVDSYPPNIHNRNKAEVFRRSCPKDGTHAGEIIFSRWREVRFPVTSDISNWRTRLQIRKDVFGYEPTEKEGLMEWYLNFANYEIFTDYGGPLFAQDELQVAEHPALASLKEALVCRGETTRTVENGRPTPILMRNVERRCAIDTKPCRERPMGLYGNEFAGADPEDIIEATQLIVPPTISNIVAMEAPSSGYGAYSAETVEYIFSTAFTGFSAARFDFCSGGASEIAIHTGFWRCGAYGGNRILMAVLQIIAANMVGINQLVFHVLNDEGAESARQAVEFIRNGIHYDQPQMEVADILGQIVYSGYEWGESDGN